MHNKGNVNYYCKDLKMT